MLDTFGLPSQNPDTDQDPKLTDCLGEATPTVPDKSRSVAVCKCQLERAECSTCNFGYLQAAKAGQMPLFKKVAIVMKKVPVCACGKQRDKCSDCQEGYLEMIMKGQSPKFMEVEEDKKDDSDGTSLQYYQFLVFLFCKVVWLNSQ